MRTSKETALEPFEQFAKGAPLNSTITNNCVIYTRVSTKEQAEHNMSLETQGKACQEYARKKGYTVMGQFGGTYESAKNDERKEFKKMLEYVKKSKQKISYIIVYSTDRFSRSGANAIWIAAQLKKEKLYIYAVTQPTDTTTASGSFQQNVHFIFSEYDNQLRREKTIAGLKEKLLKGEWPNHAPVGYDHITRNGKAEIVVNEKGKLIRQAFMWKANEGVSNVEVIKRLSALGLKITPERCTEVLRNPFYCGLIAHKLLEGKVIEGKHERLISKEVFLKVNEVQNKNPYGYTTNPKNDRLPLKTFLKCDHCGKYMRGYTSTKWNLSYYKCNSVGCKCNKRADELHNSFAAAMSYLGLEEKYRDVVRYELEATLNTILEGKTDAIDQIKKSIAELDKKIKRLRERFALDEIDREMYQEFSSQFIAERAEHEKELAKLDFEWSKSEDCINEVVDKLIKLPSMWVSSNYEEKQKIQKMVFPEGIRYNKENGECRSEKVNTVFSYIAGLAEDLNPKGHEQKRANLEKFGWGTLSGVEECSLAIG